MKYATKRFLISSDQLQRLQNLTNSKSSKEKIHNPFVKATKSKKKELRDILSNPTTNEFDKVLHYADGFNRYLRKLKTAVNTSKSKAILGSNSTPIIIPSSPLNQSIAPSYSTPLPSSPAFSTFVSPIPSEKYTSDSESESDETNSLSIENSGDHYSSAASSSFAMPPKTPPSSPSYLSRNLPSKISLSPAPVRERTQAQKYTKAKVLDQVSPGYKELAKQYLDQIESDPHMTWNTNTGVMQLHNSPYKDTNIVSFIQDKVLQKPVFTESRKFNKLNKQLNHQS